MKSWLAKKFVEKQRGPLLGNKTDYRSIRYTLIKKVTFLAILLSYLKVHVFIGHNNSQIHPTMVFHQLDLVFLKKKFLKEYMEN